RRGWGGRGRVLRAGVAKGGPLHRLPRRYHIPCPCRGSCRACRYRSCVRRYGMVGSLFRTLVSSRGFPLRSHLDQSRFPLSLGRGRRITTSGLLLCRSSPPSSFCPAGPSSPPISFPVHLLIFYHRDADPSITGGAAGFRGLCGGGEDRGYLGPLDGTFRRFWFLNVP